MDITPSSLSARIALAKYLKDAVDDFQSILTEDQRTELRRSNFSPDTHAVLMFTAQLDYSSRSMNGRSIASRLYSVLQSVREFSAIVGTFTSPDPEIPALIWGSVKLTMEVRIGNK